MTCNGAWHQATVLDGYTCTQAAAGTVTCEKPVGTDASLVAKELGLTCGSLTANTVYTVDETACNALKDKHKDDENWPTEEQKSSWGYVSVCGGATSSMTAFGAAIVAAIAALAF